MTDAAAAHLHDGGTIWWYRKFITTRGNLLDSLVVFRTDAAGRLVWNPTFDESFLGYAYNWTQAEFVQMLEMQNGNLLFSADVGVTFSWDRPKPDFTLLMLDRGGNRLWQNDYVGYTYGALAEGLNGDILSWSKGRLTRFDANGNVLTQIQYQAGAGFSTSWPSIACIGDRIYLEGLYKQTTGFGWGNERGFYLIKTDYTTGNILDSRRYRLNPTDPSADTSDPGISNFTTVRRGAGFVFTTNILSPSNTQFELLLLSIDTNLNIVRPGLDMIKPVYAIPPTIVFLGAHCHTNDAGITACSFGELLNRHLSYYAEMDEQGNFLAQRLLQFANPQYVLSAFPGNGNALQLAMVSSQDQPIPYFLYANNSPDLMGGPGCGGIDTSFITMHPVMPAGRAITFTPNPLSSLAQSPVSTLSSATSIATSSVCLQKSHCDSIKINGPDSVCVGETGVRFTTTKNPDCLRYTDWSMDTSLVSVQSRPDDTTLILAFRGSGHPWLSASPRACSVKDSLQLTIRALRNVDLGGDTTLCPGDSLILNAGSGFLRYTWQNASTDSLYKVDGAGTYIVQVVDQCNHTSADTAIIGYLKKTLSAGPDRTLCANENSRLTASAGFSFYTWQPSSAIAGDTTGQTVTIQPTATTRFIVTAFDMRSCPLHDTVLVTVTNCLNRLLVPGAFTPNHDGKNDLLRPVVIGHLVRYEFTIYNRWGQTLFRSFDPGAGWDGRIQDHLQPAGTFVWTCQYQFAGEEPTSAKGVFLLVR